MIQSLWRTKWLALVKITSYVPKQSCCITSLRYVCTISPQDGGKESSFSISDPKSSPSSELFRSATSEKSKLVLEFLGDCGLSETQIQSVVSGWPRILLSDPKKTLKPKVDFFLSKGISRAEIVRILLEEPKALTRSLEKHLIPVFDFLESVVGSEKAARIVRNYAYIFRSSTRGSLELNTMKLQNIGVPEPRIAKMIVNRCRTILPHPSRFEKAITIVKEMGFKPTDSTFGNAVCAIGWCSKVAWKGKMDLFRSYGLSNAEIVAGFKKQPLIMIFKKENITAKLNFFVKIMHWCPRKLLIMPNILTLSLEKRVIPRLSVLYVLMQQGEVLKGEIVSVQNFLKMTEKVFIQKYITNYQDKVLEVLNAHKGKLKFGDLHAVDLNTAFKRNEYFSGS